MRASARVTMTEEIPPDYIDYVQQTYFRTGLDTHLYMNTSEESDGICVNWVFTFQDFGCTHTLSREAVMGMLVDTGELTVDNVPYPDLQAVETAIFDGHYAKYMQDLFEFEGLAAS
jgi:hypothetical protein